MLKDNLDLYREHQLQQEQPKLECTNGCDIYEGETCYLIDGKIYCQYCINESKEEC